MDDLKMKRLFYTFAFCVLFWWGSADGAGGDCMSGNNVDCFECNTWDDPRCHDPFNYTARKEDMPPIRECEGCCVKMVQFIGTEHYQIRRTCTDDFEVNFFMVNHACMTEGHRHGHMCFCEEDECNGSPRSIVGSHPFLIFFAVVLYRFYSQAYSWTDPFFSFNFFGGKRR